MSSELRYAIISPDDILIPLLMASVCPSSGSEIHLINGSYIFKYIQGFICASSVDYDIFKIWVILQKYRSYRFFDIFPLIVARGDDADFQRE